MEKLQNLNFFKVAAYINELSIRDVLFPLESFTFTLPYPGSEFIPKAWTPELWREAMSRLQFTSQHLEEVPPTKPFPRLAFHLATLLSPCIPDAAQGFFYLAPLRLNHGPRYVKNFLIHMLTTNLGVYFFFSVFLLDQILTFAFLPFFFFLQ
jgi:hypothetical protein